MFVEMILTTPSSSSVKAPSNPARRYSDLPPSYDAAEAEPHGFIDGKSARRPTAQRPLDPLVTGGPPTSKSSRSGPLTPNRLIKDTSEPLPLYLNPNTGEPLVGYTVSDVLLVQCNQYGHMEKTRFGTWGIISAALFFPWGLLCLMGSRVVYCKRCGVVLRGANGCCLAKGARKLHHKREND